MPYRLNYSICGQILDQQEFDRLTNKQTKPSIQTVTDLFASDYSKLKLTARRKNLDFSKLLQLRQILLKQFEIQCLNFSSVKSLQNPCQIKCGSAKLDPFFCVIFQKSPFGIIEICGPSASGKTQLALSLCIETAKIGTKILFIDCDLSFSRNRLLKMAHFKNCSQAALFQAFQLFHVFKFEKLIDLLQQLSADYSNHNSLLIIDSISSIVLTNNFVNETTNLSELHRRRLASICHFCEVLKCVAYQANLYMVVTRLSTSEIRIKWDDLLAADLKIALEPQLNSTQINANVLSRKIDEVTMSKKVEIEINDQGIQ